MSDPIVAMNMASTIHRQDNRCLDCKTELPTDHNSEVYFIMIQKQNIYEVYCLSCGNKKRKNMNND